MIGKVCHLVVRYTEDMYDIDHVTVWHNQAASRHGAVWVGKPFHMMGRIPMDIINQQIAEGVEPRLYFIDTKRTRPVAHFGKLLAVTMKAPDDRELMPVFYKQKKILSRMKVWMKVDFLQGFYLSDLPVLEKMNAVYDDMEMLADKSSGYFLLYEDME